MFRTKTKEGQAAGNSGGRVPAQAPETAPAAAVDEWIIRAQGLTKVYGDVTAASGTERCRQNNDDPDASWPHNADGRSCVDRRP